MVFATFNAHSTTHAPLPLDSENPSEDLVKEAYERYCKTCHGPSPSLFLGAPAFKDKNAWAEHSPENLDKLLQSVKNGKGLMPAQGGCFECSDVLLEYLIKYLLPEVQPGS